MKNIAIIFILSSNIMLTVNYFIHTYYYRYIINRKPIPKFITTSIEESLHRIRCPVQ